MEKTRNIAKGWLPSAVQSNIQQPKFGCRGSFGVRSECEPRGRGLLMRRRAANKPEIPAVPPIVHDALRSPGRPLDSETRTFMETRFGHDFSKVRVHHDVRAAESAGVMNALAYTVGRDIVFGAGQYEPGTSSGQRLLAHELTHVVQHGAKQGKLDIRRVWRQTENGGSKREDLPEETVGEKSGSAAGNQGAGNAVQCEPKGLSRADYLKMPGTSSDDFGLTRLSGQVIEPVVSTSKAPRGRGVILDPTDAALPSLTSVYTEAGTFVEGEGLVGGSGECPNKKYPVKWLILQSGAKKIREGEIEHCIDFRYAFDISLRRYADAVNKFAAKKTVFASAKEAKKRIGKLVGAAPDTWSGVFQCLAEKTKARDGTKAMPGWHTPRPQYQAPRLKDQCSFIQAMVSDRSLPDVGKHPAPDIIKDCGE